jgi:hypothetical protein
LFTREVALFPKRKTPWFFAEIAESLMLRFVDGIDSARFRSGGFVRENLDGRIVDEVHLAAGGASYGVVCECRRVERR